MRLHNEPRTPRTPPLRDPHPYPCTLAASSAPHNCSGESLATCKAACGALPECGGFNFPHGIMKKTDCLAKKSQVGSGNLWLKETKPQPPGPVPPPGPPPPEVMYDAINVWPMPTSVTRCLLKSCLGPHTLSATAAVDIDSSCSVAVAPLAKEALTLATAFKAPTRTYDEGPYAKADSYCVDRCSTDSDCSAAGATCYVPSDRRWSHKVPCPPTSKYNSGCGCCATAPADDQGVLPAIPTVRVSCGDNTVTATEGYTLTVTAEAVTIAASTSHGAAYGLTTLAQLLRFDTALATAVLDFVPLHVADSPLYGWRGHMLDTSRVCTQPTPTLGLFQECP